MPIKVIVTNRKAFHEYNVIETVEAGIALTGSEIKSVRTGRVSLGDAYVKSEGKQMWLYNAHIARYDAASYMGHDPVRPRRLLLHRKEIVNFTSQSVQRGFTLIPLRLYIKDSYAKLEIALAKGKRQFDKREVTAERESKRRLDRVIKTRPATRK
jgi:SsrA-binding protein